MNKLILAALVALPMVAGPAVAAEGRMSGTEVVRAARCVAYSNLVVLQSDRLDTSALAAALNAELERKPDEVRKSAARETRRVHINATQADTPGEVEKLRGRRDRLCAPFVEASLVVAAN